MVQNLAHTTDHTRCTNLIKDTKTEKEAGEANAAAPFSILSKNNLKNVIHFIIIMVLLLSLSPVPHN